MSTIKLERCATNILASPDLTTSPLNHNGSMLRDEIASNLDPIARQCHSIIRSASHSDNFFAPNRIYQGATTFISELDRRGELAKKKSYGEIFDEAVILAEEMRRLGWSGRRILLCLHNGIEFIEIMAACLIANVVPVPVSMARSSSQKVRLMHIARDAGVCATLVDNTSLVQMLDCAYVGQVATVSALKAGEFNRIGKAPASNTDMAFIQYTSGSTSMPKGVQISQESLKFNVDLIAKQFRFKDTDIFMSWLPMFHDFGLVGFVYTQLRYGMDLICMDPFSFIQKPLRWLTAMSRYKATISGAPNFAYHLIGSRVTESDVANLDLSHWRVAVNGAEPISKKTLDAFVTILTPAGFNKSMVLPCYGLAEATLLVTSGEAGGGYMSKEIALHGDANQMVSVVSSGYVNEDAPVRITDPNTGLPMPDGAVGEILVGGDGLFSGYLGQSETLSDNRVTLENRTFFKTGDLGFIEDGLLFVLGRKNDIINIRGRNIYPSDIEDVVSQVISNNKPNSVIAFGIKDDEREKVVIVVEAGFAQAPLAQIDALKSKIRKTVIDALKIAVDEIVLFKPNKLPKTSSGKPQRSACRDLFLSTELESYSCVVTEA